MDALRKMRAATIMTGIIAALWAALLWNGFEGVRDIHAQHAAGYPSSGQVFYYVGIPSLVIAILSLAAVVLNLLRRLPELLVVTSGCAFLFLLPYLIGYTGGV